MDRERLLDILTYKRPAYSNSQREVIHEYIDAVPGMCRDRDGNRYIVTGGCYDNPTTMFTCHTDTVHGKSGRQGIQLDSSLDVVFLAGVDMLSSRQGHCLGADDGAGIEAMLCMIESGVPGLYVFFQAEEIGGVGSTAFADRWAPELLLSEVARCISFDRSGCGSIITHQFGERCCSDEFALSLGDQLGRLWEPDHTGLYTDSFEFMELIPECTNLSVGYENEHTPYEMLDLRFLEGAIASFIAVDWDSLPTVRTATPTEWGTYTDDYANRALQINPDMLDGLFNDTGGSS